MSAIETTPDSFVDFDDSETSQVDCPITAWIFASWAGVVFFVMFGLLISFTFTIIKHRTRKDITKLTRFMKLMPVFVFVFFAIGALSKSVYNFVRCVVHIPDVYRIFLSVFYGVGLHAIAIIFIYRLYIIISDSLLFHVCVKRAVFTCAWLMWTSSAVLAGFANVASVLYPDTDLSIEIFGIGAIIYAVMAISLQILFFYTLNKLAKEMHVPNDAKVRKRLVKLVANMSKLVILVSIGLLSSILSAILFGVVGLGSTVTFSTDILVNGICLYLQFSFADNTFHLVCKPFHFCVQRMFWGNIDRSMLAEYQQDDQKEEKEQTDENHSAKKTTQVPVQVQREIAAMDAQEFD